MTIRSDAKLADGRELFYYDAGPGRTHNGVDQRELADSPTFSQIRWDPLFRDFSTIADHRQGRTYRPPDDLCPLCPSRDGAHTEIPDTDYEVAVFENRFPAYSLNSSSAYPLVGEFPFKSGPGNGRCEVVCFSSDHNTSFAKLTAKQIETVIDAWTDRTIALSAIESVKYVYCFENRGEEMGVTLRHPHGQIYGYPFVPPRFFNAAEVMRSYRTRTGRCLQCDLLQSERHDAKRIVCESEHWICYVPYGARWPYEVRVVARRHVPDLPSLTRDERVDLAQVYPDVLARFDSLFRTPAPYVAGWQQAPVGAHEQDWHLAAEVFTIRRAEGKLKYLAGSESGAGVWINDVLPEVAAARLRRELDLS